MRSLISSLSTFGLGLLVILAGEVRAVEPGTASESAARFSSDAHAALGALRGMVEEHTQGVVRTLRVIADSDEAKSGKW